VKPTTECRWRESWLRRKDSNLQPSD
jgi:hypothetical protein